MTAYYYNISSITEQLSEPSLRKGEMISCTTWITLLFIYILSCGLWGQYNALEKANAKLARLSNRCRALSAGKHQLACLEDHLHGRMIDLSREKMDLQHKLLGHDGNHFYFEADGEVSCLHVDSVTSLPELLSLEDHPLREPQLLTMSIVEGNPSLSSPFP